MILSRLIIIVFLSENLYIVIVANFSIAILMAAFGQLERSSWQQPRAAI
jgi:hypothetical protein